MNSDYIATRQFGDARVSIILDGTLRWAPQLIAPEDEWQKEMPDADATGTCSFSSCVAHIAIGNASILVDLGFDDPSANSQWMPPDAERTAGVQAGITSIGAGPESITHVLITHVHGDHIAGGAVNRDGKWQPRFPNAQHFIGRADWESNPDRLVPDSLAAIHLGTIEKAGRLTLIDSETDVAPSVTMIPAPGESPGHSIVRVRSGGECFYFVGDLFHHGCEVSHPGWVSPGRDRPVMQASRERFFAEAVPAGATIAFAHEVFPPWGRIEATGSGFRWQREG